MTESLKILNENSTSRPIATYNFWFTTITSLPEFIIVTSYRIKNISLFECGYLMLTIWQLLSLPAKWALKYLEVNISCKIRPMQKGINWRKPYSEIAILQVGHVFVKPKNNITLEFGVLSWVENIYKLKFSFKNRLKHWRCWTKIRRVDPSQLINFDFLQ